MVQKATHEVISFPVDLKGPDRIRRIMQIEGISQKEIAEKIGISEAHISFMLRGDRAVTPTTALQFSKSYGGIAEDYIWTPPPKKIPSGLVTGDHLKELCGKAGVLTEVEQEDIMLGFVKLRLGNEVCVQDPESPGGLRPVDIASSPLSLNPDEKAHVLVRETLRLPSDILATIRLLPEKMTEALWQTAA